MVFTAGLPRQAQRHPRISEAGANLRIEATSGVEDSREIWRFWSAVAFGVRPVPAGIRNDGDIERAFGAFFQQLGQGFAVENRTGADMLVGTTAAAKAAPDGYTLLVGLTGNMSVNSSGGS
jgi:hypothetical protein